MRFLSTFICFTLGAFFSSCALASDIILLDDEHQEYIVADNTVEIFTDSTGKMSFDEVHQLYEVRPSAFSTKGQLFTNSNASYWMRFIVRDQSSGIHDWLLEFYDNRLDEIVMYQPMSNGEYRSTASGDHNVFKNKTIQHINFVFPLNGISSEGAVIYVKLHSSHEVFVYALIRSVERFIDYTTHEYFYVAIFYGILLSLAVYNLLLLLSLRDRDYSSVYYILYVLSTGFYALSRDGMGFQFVWPSFPALNYFAEPLGLYCVAISLLLYAKEFLNTQEYVPWLNRLIMITVILRTLIFAIGLTIDSAYIRNVYMDIPLMFLAYFAGFVSYRRGYEAARYYIIGFTFLLVWIAIIILEAMGVSIDGSFSFYSYNMGVLIQFVVLSIALGDRVRILVKQKNTAREELIAQLKKQDAYKDEINALLEEKVKARTQELEEKNTQLDSFVYKASHDIKGPLRSLMGLTKVGMVEFEENKAVSVYFQHIMRTAARLDVILEDLLTVTKLKTVQLRKGPINLEAMKNDILHGFSHLSGFDKLMINFQLEKPVPLITDEKVLYSILQNLFENAIKYQDEHKEKAILDVQITVNKKEAVFIFRDNGCGIEAGHLSRIFDMFYKVNEKSMGSGLGLYILKQAIQKLNGSVRVESKQGEGTVFTVTVPNG